VNPKLSDSFEALCNYPRCLIWSKEAAVDTKSSSTLWTKNDMGNTTLGKSAVVKPTF
jgi:hypothetical protein